MPKVFISHSWEDNDIARRLAEQLKRDGAEIWIDYARISGGDSLPKRIGDAIEWCDTLILVWSVSAKSSYWVNKEWETALALQRKIVPSVLDDAILPVILRSLLYIPLQDFDKGYRQLVRSFDLQVQDTISPLAEKSIQIHLLSIEQPASPTKTEINGIGRNKVTPSMLFFPCFRQKPSILSKDDVEAMLKRLDFFDLRYNSAGKGFVNDYELKTINRDKVVIDRVSSLMWQQGGSEEYMTKAKADEWIKSLNVKGYAGYKNWRLPTLEEAMSLMEPELKNGDLFINSIFDETQRWIWTSDNVKDGPGVWIVGFVSGSCGSDDRLSHGFVRAVRFRQSSAE